MGDRLTCDVAVLGMGTCGEDAALRLARSGLDVVGIEANLIGGECPYWACLPTKSLARSAELVAEARRADGLVGTVSVETDWGIIADRIRAEITGGWADEGGVTRFEAQGGRFVRGWGRITAPRIVEVDGTVVEARIGILVATGSSAFVPPIPGLSDVDYWTNHEAIATKELPERLIVLGGGAAGCELAQVFARFGSRVTIVEGADRIVPAEEPEASAVVAEAFEEDGIDIRTGARTERIEQSDAGITVTLDTGETLATKALLVATGRRADADAVGVAEAGAETDRGRIVVDGRMRAADGLWAIGDVTGLGMLTSVAEYQGRIAVEDILGANPEPADYTSLPRATFTDPEIGSVGVTEAQAREQGLEVDTVVKDLQATFRGWLHRTGNTGMIKLVADRGTGTLVGATVVGPAATETLGFLSLAIRQRTPLTDLVNSIYAFPTFYGAVGEALGAYGRGITRVLDPGTPPMFDDPPA